MTKCKKLETVYSSDMEDVINKFVADKEVISVSIIETERRWIAFVVYKVIEKMTKEQLENYLSDLNLNYYTEEELQEIYNSVKSTIDRIEERIGREG